MDLKCAVCFLTLVVGTTAYSSSSDVSPDNLAGSCDGPCLEDQSAPQLMLVQRQAIRMTEEKTFEKVEDQTLEVPIGAHQFEVACSAHPKCAGMDNDCCPTKAGVMLSCCEKGEEEDEEGGSQPMSWEEDKPEPPTCAPSSQNDDCEEAVRWAFSKNDPPFGKKKQIEWYDEKLTLISGIQGESPSSIVESASQEDFQRLFFCGVMKRNVGKCTLPPCSCTNPPCDLCPTEAPTETPTSEPEPTEAPTPEETSYGTPTPEPTAGAVGDPHVTNIRGEKFNVFKTGHMEFLRVPFKSAYTDANLTLLGVVQDIVGTSDECEQQRYITSVFFGGAWMGDRKLNVSIQDGELAVRLGTSFARINSSDHEIPIGDLLHLHAHDKEQLQLRAGEMAIGVSAAGNHNGKHFFLNLEAKSLTALNTRIGGLLGEDSHDDVSAPPLGCLPKPKLMMKNGDAFSFATAEP